MRNFDRLGRIKWRYLRWDDARHRLELIGNKAPSRRSSALWLVFWLALLAFVVAAIVILTIDAQPTLPRVHRY